MTRLKAIVSSQGIRQSALFSLSNIVATGISAISLIILSRYLGPSAFGAFSVAFSLTMFLAKLFDFGLNMSQQKYVAQSYDTDPKTANQIITYTSIIKIVTTIGIFLCAFALTPVLASLLGMESYSTLIMAAILLTIVIFWFDFGIFLFQGLRSFKKGAAMMITQASAKVAAIAAIVFMGIKSVQAAYISYSLAPIIGIIVGILLLPKGIRWIRGISSQHKKLLLTMMINTGILSVSIAFADHVDTLFVKAFSPTYQTGLFAAASRISLLLGVVAFSMSGVLNSRVARYSDKHHLTKYLGKTTLLIAVVLIGSVFILPLSKLLILITAGSAYLGAVATLNLLMISGMVYIATTPLMAVFYAVERPSYFSLSGILLISLLIITDLVLIPLYGIEGAGWARLITRVGVFVFSIMFVAHTVRKTHHIQLLDVYNSAKTIIHR